MRKEGKGRGGRRLASLLLVLAILLSACQGREEASSSSSLSSSEASSATQYFPQLSAKELVEKIQAYYEGARGIRKTVHAQMSEQTMIGDSESDDQGTVHNSFSLTDSITQKRESYLVKQADGSSRYYEKKSDGWVVSQPSGSQSRGVDLFGISEPVISSDILLSRLEASQSPEGYVFDGSLTDRQIWEDAELRQEFEMTEEPKDGADLPVDYHILVDGKDFHIRQISMDMTKKVGKMVNLFERPKLGQVVVTISDMERLDQPIPLPPELKDARVEPSASDKEQ